MFCKFLCQLHNSNKNDLVTHPCHTMQNNGMSRWPLLSECVSTLYQNYQLPSTTLNHSICPVIPSFQTKTIHRLALPPPPTHWALDPREVILQSQNGKIWKLVKSNNVWCLTILMRVVMLFQTSFAHIWEIYYGTFEGFIKNALTQSIF